MSCAQRGDGRYDDDFVVVANELMSSGSCNQRCDGRCER